MKDLIRKSALEKRKRIRSPEKDGLILKNLFELSEYVRAKNVLIYCPLKYEINILPCLKNEDKRFFIPRVSDNFELEICPYDKNALKKGYCGITEPCNDKIRNISDIDTVITPAAAVDKQGFRIGYGKGYYDRLFSKEGFNPIKIVLIYKELIYDTIQPCSCDKKIDIAVCEDKIYRF